MAATLREPGKTVPVIGRYDVVVLGGGPAGVAAAVSAARGRAKTLLVEQTGCLGGLGTSGLVPVFCPFSRTKKPLIRGIGLEILSRLRAAGGAGRSGVGEGIPIDAERLKRVCDELVGRERIDVLFFTFFSDVIRRGRLLKAALLENKAGRSAMTGKVFVDATGDADAAARAGVPFEMGDPRGRMQAAGLCIVVADVDIPRYWRYVEAIGDSGAVAAWWRDLEKHRLLPRFPNTEYRGLHGFEVGPGILGFNFAHLFAVDGTRPADLSRAMIVGRAMAHAFVEYARKRLPGMKRARLVSSAAIPGIRETRRIQGRYRLTMEDCLTGRHFPDEIARYDYPVDVHNVARDPRLARKYQRDFRRLALPPGRSYGIPYRCLLPVGVDNLLVAGRALSADREAQGSARPMPACFAMGEAAGTAAALSCRRRTTPARLDARVLRRALRLPRDDDAS